MGWNDIEAKWHALKGAAKARWAQLSDDDFAEIKGDREALKAKLMEKKAAADGKLAEWKQAADAKGSELSAELQSYKEALQAWADEEIETWQKEHG